MKPPEQQRTIPALDAEAPASAPTTDAAHAHQRHPVSATVTLLPLEPDPDTRRFYWNTKLLANEAAGHNARFRTRPRLTVARWSGDVDLAGQIVDRLVDNAARHGKPFGNGCVLLRLTVLAETDELRIEVDDADPTFPASDAVTSGSHPRGRGLWWVQNYGGYLSWDLKRDDDGRVVGKTVTAVMQPADGRESV
ncbi:ATP-binding protein [Streptomyces massasporeus]